MALDLKVEFGVNLDKKLQYKVPGPQMLMRVCCEVALLTAPMFSMIRATNK